MKLSDIKEIVEKHQTSEIKIHVFTEIADLEMDRPRFMEIEFEVGQSSKTALLRYYSNINEFEKEIIENIQELEKTYKL